MHMMRGSPRPCSCDPNERYHNPDNYMCYLSCLKRHSDPKDQAPNNRIEGRTVYNVYVCGGILAHELDPFRESLLRSTYMLKKAVCCTVDQKCWGCNIITSLIKDKLDRNRKPWRAIIIQVLWDQRIRIGHRGDGFQDGELAPIPKLGVDWFKRIIENQRKLRKLQSLHLVKGNDRAWSREYEDS